MLDRLPRLCVNTDLGFTFLYHCSQLSVYLLIGISKIENTKSYRKQKNTQSDFNSVHQWCWLGNFFLDYLKQTIAKSTNPFFKYNSISYHNYYLHLYCFRRFLIICLSIDIYVHIFYLWEQYPVNVLSDKINAYC